MSFFRINYKTILKQLFKLCKNTIINLALTVYCKVLIFRYIHTTSQNIKDRLTKTPYISFCHVENLN